MPMNIPTMPSMPFMGQNNVPRVIHQNGPGSLSDGPMKPYERTSIDMGIMSHPAHQDPPKAQAASHAAHGGGYSVTCILFTGIIVVAGIFIGIACLVNSLHRVQEGNVAVYFTNGALQEGIVGPGLHMSTPFITTILQVTVRPETFYLNPLQCTTSDGVMNVFREVQVISSIDQDRLKPLITNFGNDIKQVLVYDRIQEGIQSFCANNSIDEVYNTKFMLIEGYVKKHLNDSITKFANNAISVWNLFIPKPDIPPAIAQNYREVKIEWTRQLVAQQKKKTERIKKETILQNGVLDAERAKAITLIEARTKIEKAEEDKQEGALLNEMKKNRETTLIDIGSYRAASQAENNKDLLSDQYIKMELAKSLAKNTKMYFSGQDSALGGVLNSLLNVGGEQGK